MKYSTFILSLLLTASGIAQAGVFEQDDLNQGYAYLNALRVRAGMTPFLSNAQLELAAFNHANFIVDNSLMGGHYEVNTLPGFTGVEPKDRMVAAGYRSLAVSENVSSGQTDTRDSIDNLMSAIYHRFGFLDFDMNEVGIGIAKTSLSDPNSHTAYVYNMGNSELNALCDGPAFSGYGRYYTRVCEPDININANDFETVQTLARGNNPNIVQWPTDGDEDVPPVFFEESPDPLPDYSVSGYPISLQFNPLTFSHVTLIAFKLYRETDNLEIQPTRLLTQTTDPNSQMTGLQYALFPLERLDWNTAYRVEAIYSTDTETQTLTWRFKTRNLNLSLYTLQGIGEVMSIPQNTGSFAVYIPPTALYSEMGSINYSYESSMVINTQFIDGNTLQINMTGQVGQKATFNLSGGRSFVVQITEAVNTCQVPSLSSDVTTLYIPNLYYTPPDESPILVWMNLERSLEDSESLHFKIIDYDLTVDQGCEVSPLYFEEGRLKMHIPNLHYTPEGETQNVLWVNLEFLGDSLFKVINYGFKE
jgi:uncharacterized protein YkwD